MSTWIYSWCAATVLLTAEIILGNWGFFIPISAASVLYFSATTSWKNGFFLAIYLGLALDGIYARDLPVATVLLTAALLFNRHMFPESIRNYGVPSALCSGLGFAFFLEIVLLLIGEPVGFWQAVVEVPFSILCRTVGFGVFVFLADAVANRIGATPYCVDLETPPSHHGGRVVSQAAVAPERNSR